MKKINSAIILAAGKGSRLDEFSVEKPKGFLNLAGEIIIERSIQQLISVGINNIVIVTGHLSESFNSLSEHYQCVKTIYNNLFAVSGSMYSLYTAKDLVNDTFLLLESDLIYESRALDELISFPQQNVILASSFTGAGDEVFVSAQNGCLKGLSKSRSRLLNVMGEMVGIAKISLEMLNAMVGYAESYFNKSLSLEYETCISEISSKVDVFHCKVDNLIWAEIDNVSQLHRAKHKVMPLLIEKDRIIF